MKSLSPRSHNQTGFAHLGIILAVVGVVAIGALVAWRFMGTAKDSTASVSSELAQKIASAKCEYDDKDLCKFFVSFKEHKQYKMVTTAAGYEGENGPTTSTYEVDGDNWRSVTTGQYASEIIMIGEFTTYTKAPNGTWWKQTREPSDAPVDTELTPTDTTDFEEPTTDETADPTIYKALGKEACGTLTCFKYQVVDKSSEGTTQYIWFDTKDYQLRRTTYASDGMSSDTTFSYDKVSVKAPGSFKELGPNQYLMPGENEPTTMPTAADYGM